MKEEEKLLNRLYQELSKGAMRLERLENKAGEGSLKRAIYKQRLGYLRHRAKVESALEDINGKRKTLNPFVKFYHRQRNNFKTLFPLKESDLASLIIRGSTEEIIKTTKTVNHYPLVNDKVSQVAYSFIKYEQANIDQIKEYL